MLSPSTSITDMPPQRGHAQTCRLHNPARAHCSATTPRTPLHSRPPTPDVPRRAVRHCEEAQRPLRTLVRIAMLTVQRSLLGRQCSRRAHIRRCCPSHEVSALPKTTQRTPIALGEAYKVRLSPRGPSLDAPNLCRTRRYSTAPIRAVGTIRARPRPFDVCATRADGQENGPRGLYCTVSSRCASFGGWEQRCMRRANAGFCTAESLRLWFDVRPGRFSAHHVGFARSAGRACVCTIPCT